MSLYERFMAELPRSPTTELSDLDPSTLALAAASALGVAGAGIAFNQPLLRVPLGASSEEVRAAESLQATLGDGPCVVAARDDTTVLVDEGGLRSRWPIYYAGLVDQTSFRSAGAVPLWSGRRALGALNIYDRGSAMNHLVDLEVVRAELVGPLSAILLGVLTNFDQADLDEQPRWSNQAQINRRLQVWTAVGMVMESAGCDDHDALSMLRSFAFRHDSILDDVSERLVERDLSVQAITAPSD